MLSWDFILLYNCDLIKHWLEHRARTCLVYKQSSACKHKALSGASKRYSPCLALPGLCLAIHQCSSENWARSSVLLAASIPGVHPTLHFFLRTAVGAGGKCQCFFWLANTWIEAVLPREVEGRRVSFNTQCWQAAIHTQIQLTRSLSSPRRENVSVLDPIKSLLLFIL